MPPNEQQEKEETHEQKIVKLLAEMRDELREARKPHRHWYGRSPVRELITHFASVLVAVMFGYALHVLTGAPVTIEAHNELPRAVDSAMASTQRELPAIEVTATPEATVSVDTQERVSIVPPAPSKPRKQLVAVGTATSLAMVPAAPVPAATASVPVLVRPAAQATAIDAK
jgi:hypothetical protein